MPFENRPRTEPVERRAGRPFNESPTVGEHEVVTVHDRMSLFFAVLLAVIAVACGGGSGGTPDNGPGSAMGSATTSTIIDIGSRYGGNGLSNAVDINGTGIVVGSDGDGDAGAQFELIRWTKEDSMAPLIPHRGKIFGTNPYVNDRGQIAYLDTAAGGTPSPSRPVLVDGQNRISLSDTDAFALTGLNNAGEVTGCDVTAVLDPLACWIWIPGPTSGTGAKRYFSPDVFPLALNDAGDVAANVFVNGSTDRTEFLRSDGTSRPIPTLGGPSVTPAALNTNGIVVGSADTTMTYTLGIHAIDIPVQHPFLFETSTGLMVDLDMRSDGGGAATAINGAGYVVGYRYSFTVNDGLAILSENRAFVYHPRFGIRDLIDLVPDTDGWRLVSATDINDALQVVGTGFHNGVERGFVIDLAPLL